MQSRFTQLFSSVLIPLFGKVFLKRNRLLKVKCFEVTVFGVDLESVERLG